MIRPAKIFADRMVLQREKPILIFGEAEPGEQITISLAGQETCTAADETGHFSAELPAMEAARDLTLTMTSPENSITVSDIAIGEVWIAGGQSNMEYPLHNEAEFNAGRITEENRDIRFFDVPMKAYEDAPKYHDFSDYNFWRCATKEDLPWFSAVGYYFADLLQKDLQIPIGIVGCNWGGTIAAAWMSEETIESSEAKVWLEDYLWENEGVSEEEYRAYAIAHGLTFKGRLIDSDQTVYYPGYTRERQLEIVAQSVSPKAKTREQKLASMVGPLHQNRPAGLYHTMLETIVPYRTRGLLWYQGESDDKHADVYDRVMEALVKNWREIWGEQLPFLFVQMAPYEGWLQFTGERFPELREAQKRALDLIPDSYMASNTDGGMQWDIHPKKKRSVGERLALLARGHVYGEDILCDAPEFDFAELVNGEVHIHFKNGRGLHLVDEMGASSLSGEVNAMSVNQVSAIGRIENDILIVPCQTNKRQQDIRFAQTPYFRVNLYNEAGIPAMPFAQTI